MPGGDGTGPWGWGRKTGRGAGFCSGYKIPGFMNRFALPRFGGRWLALRRRSRFGRRFKWRW